MRITLRNVCKSYVPASGMPVTAVNGVSIDFPAGTVTAITGPSGAGKSTLLHMLGLMDTPTTGTIHYDGVSCSVLNESARADLRRKELGFLFQMHYLLPEFSVSENVLMPVWDDRDRHRERVHALLARLGIAHRAGHYPHELSGGEQQRAALARALVNEPSVLLADEPTGNLDSATGAAVQELMLNECKRRNMSVIMVTHHLGLARVADRTVSMRDGSIMEDSGHEDLP